jgi:hypothetical protein
LKGELVRYRNLSDPSSDVWYGSQMPSLVFRFIDPMLFVVLHLIHGKADVMAHFSHKEERQFKIGGELEVGEVSKRNI